MSNAIRLGLFIAAALLIFAAGIFWIGNQQFRFSSTYRLNAEFQNVAGLTEGANVRVGGIREGTVHRIVLPERPDQKVRVEMDLLDATQRVIKKDSVAAIRTEGLVGDQFIEITFGSAGNTGVKNGDRIATEQPMEISDILKKTNSLLDGAQIAMQNVNQTTNNLQAITAKLNNGNGTVGALINDRKLYNHVNEVANNLQEDTEALKHNFLVRGFFQKRGYENREDLKRNEIAELPSSVPANRLTFEAAKIFEKPDTAKLKSGKILDEAGKVLEQNRYGFAVVACYADLKGDSDKQRQLTEARAANARDYLVEHFKLDDMRIKTFGAGKSADAPEGGLLEVLIYPVGKTAPKK